MEDKKNKKSKKDISEKTAVKALINGFICYGFILIFIFTSLIIVIAWAINNNKNALNYDVLKYSLPILGAFIIFFLVRAVCKLSTFDLFKKCKIDKDKIDFVSSKMTAFFIAVIIFSILSIVLFLLMRFHNEKIDIEKFDYIYHSTYTNELADALIKEMTTESQENKTIVLIQTAIVEFGLILGTISLIPIQKKLIKEYN